MVDRPIEIALFILLLGQLAIGWLVYKRVEAIRSQNLKRVCYVLLAVLGAVLLAGFSLNIGRVRAAFPFYYFGERLRMAITLWLTASLAAAVATHLLGALIRTRRRDDSVDSGRRKFVATAQTIVAAVPFAVVAHAAFIERRHIRTVEVDLPVPNLAPDLDGLRIVQISDIHLSPTLEERDLAWIVDHANSLKPALTVVTGDLITKARDPLEACMRQVARLRADAGVYGCLGNHETWAQVEDEVVEMGRRCGVEFLRYQARGLRFGAADVNLVGVDYERLADESKYLDRAAHLVRPNSLNLLLSHSPDVIAAAGKKGFDVTLAGHTHGGQVTLEFVHPSLNIARYYTPYVYGRYDVPGRVSTATSYVTRGIGTIFVPARLGAPPELPLIRLRRA